MFKTIIAKVTIKQDRVIFANFSVNYEFAKILENLFRLSSEKAAKKKLLTEKSAKKNEILVN